jgi:hypothetical protein
MKSNSQSNTILNDEIEKKKSIKKKLSQSTKLAPLVMRWGQLNKKQIQC